MARKLAVAVLDDLGLHGPAATLGERPGRGIRIVAVALLLLLASGFFSFYLQTSPPLLGGVITLVLEAAGLWLLLSRRCETREVVLLAVPSIWMALSLVLGFHVVVENGYLGILTQNYLKPAGLADLFALVFMAGGIWVMAAGFYTLVVAVRARFRDRTIKMAAPRALPVAALTLAIFAFPLLNV